MDNPTSRPVEGYPRLACHMAQYSENAVFRRFSSLGTRNLLYLQAELVHLEQKLCRLEAADSASSEGRRATYSKDWYWLNDSPEENDEQLKIVLSIRSKLKEYCKRVKLASITMQLMLGLDDTIVQQSVINRLAKPDNHDLRELQDWLERQAYGNLALIGADSETWGRLHQPINSHADLLTLNSIGCEDSFSRWFSRKFIAWFCHTFRHRPLNSGDLESGIVSYSSRTIERYTSFVTTIVASLLPILSTVVLFCVPSMKLRLGIIVLFTLIFAACISSFTSTKRGEIFIATST
ncbi:uncharacterized protein K444DRAFT_625298 [Hyaloscypha bicolor E]|uniref:DUF6594 domain-containing protein n=1 Tax=Hyaloscypha bicolor E TaxID=1095630 RepID=A0A2J6TNP1_9HELO|nr:uncharacterized protein K444DRAFT_625298 [Hyaloscypha bicolor E]PMD64632.1 hypothetical protein K444DRAFT_625298 [Hyaloscypha bicolor E]